MSFLRQSTIQTIRFGPFLDSTDGVTEEEALTITQALRRLSQDGGDFAQSGTVGNATHDENGWYFVDLSAADTDTVGELILYVQDPTTHLPVWMRWMVVEENVYDAIYGAAAGIGTDVAAILVDTGTTIPGTITTLQADTDDIQTRLPAALVGGAMDSDVSAVQTGAITAAAIATDAIGAAELAADAVAEIADAVWDEPKAGHVGATTFGDLAVDLDAVLLDTGTTIPGTITTLQTDVSAVLVDTGTTIPGTITTLQADTDDIQTRLPAALVGGAMDSDVSAIQAGAITAAAIATDAIDADALATDAVLEIIGQVSGTADSGTTTTLVDAARTEADTDYWAGSVLLITSGTIAGQVRRIAAFTPASDTITVDTAFTQAVATNTYTILKTTYAEAPAAGVGDWTTGERDQIRDALGVTGTTAAAVGGQLQDVLTDTGTTIPGTITTLQADTDDIQTRLPAALVGGAMDSDVSAIQSAAITAASIATDAIGAAELAADAVAEIADGVWDEPKAGHVGATTFGDLAVDLDAVLLDTGTTIPGTITTLQSDTDDIQTRLPAALVGGAMDSDVSAIQGAAITAASIATDAIGAAELAADAVAEIADGVWDEPKAGHTTVTSFGDLATDLDSVLVDTGTTIPGTITTLQSDTDDIQTRLPAALVGGAMDSDVSAIQANAVTASALATDAVNEIRDAILPVINTAFSDISVLMVDDTDHFTPVTGLSLGVTRSIDGGAFGAGTGTAAEIGNGAYQYDASAADMNGTRILFRFTGTAADDTFITVRTGG